MLIFKNRSYGTDLGFFGVTKGRSIARRPPRSSDLSPRVTLLRRSERDPEFIYKRQKGRATVRELLSVNCAPRSPLYDPTLHLHTSILHLQKNKPIEKKKYSSDHQAPRLLCVPPFLLSLSSSLELILFFFRCVIQGFSSG